MSDFFNSIPAFLRDFGVGQGLLILLVLTALYFIYHRMNKLHDETIASKNQEIARLNAEVTSYREMFLSLLRENLLGKRPNQNNTPNKNVS